MVFLAISPHVKQVLYTSAIAGGFAALGTKVWLGIYGTMNIFGRAIEPSLVLGGVVAASSFAGEFAGQYVLPLIPRFSLIQGIESDIVAPGVTGILASQAYKMWGDSEQYAAVGGSNLVILGFGSHLLARKLGGTLKQLI